MFDSLLIFILFFFNATAPTEIYTLSLHDALPISSRWLRNLEYAFAFGDRMKDVVNLFGKDRKSTRLNSSHVRISYAVFCLNKKNNKNKHHITKLCTDQKAYYVTWDSTRSLNNNPA